MKRKGEGGGGEGGGGSPTTLSSVQTLKQPNQDKNTIGCPHLLRRSTLGAE